MAEPDAMVQLEAAIMVQLGAGASATSTDPQLAALLPGGLYSRQAGGSTYPFLNLSLVRMAEDHTYGKVYRYRFTYSISVTDAAESIDAASAALQRVFELLQDKDSEMPMEDFVLGYSRRAGRTGISPETDGVTYQRLIDEWRFEVYTP
jgi:hypothetical protein